MKQYLDFLRHIDTNGLVKKDRTGTGTKSVFGYQMRFDLQQGFPMVTTKKLHMKAIIHELLWFLSGSTNIKYLQDNGVTIWDEWADENGELGPVYGAQWRSWPGKTHLQRKDVVQSYAPGLALNHFSHMRITGFHEDTDNSGVYALQEGIDQISGVINQIKTNPDSRRLMVSAWNPAQIDQMKLPPCHALFQFYTRELTTAQRYDWWMSQGPDFVSPPDVLDFGTEITTEIMDAYGVPTRYLDCQLYQRSADSFLGVPFNIASYALLTSMIAQQCNMLPGEFVWTGGDCHLYLNHQEQATLQLSRSPTPLPKLVIKRKPNSIFDYKYEDFEIQGYQYHPAIRGPVAV